MISIHRRHVVRVFLVIALLFLIFAVWVVAPFWRISRLQRRFALVHGGMTEREVLKIIGEEPTNVRNEGRARGYDETFGEDAEQKIRRELFFSTATFFLPVSLSVAVDAEGRVVAKHRYD